MKAVKCPNGCGQSDSLEHMLKCYELTTPNENMEFHEKVRTLRRMVIKVARNSPTLPTPMEDAEVEEGELSFANSSQQRSMGVAPPSTTEEIPSSLGVSLVDELEFDGE